MIIERGLIPRDRMPLVVIIRKFTIITELITEGSSSVACSVSALVGIDATVEIQSLSFVDPADMSPKSVPRGPTARVFASLSRPTVCS